MTIIFGDSATFTGKALPKEDHTYHESINVDNGAVHIDPDHSSHVIRIEHDKGDGKDIFRAVDNATGTNTARIDSDGIAVLHDVYYHSTATGGTNTLDDLDTSVENNALVLANASAIDSGTVDNLVKRSQANGTEVDNLHVVARTSGYTASYPPAGLYFNQGTCDDSLDLLGLGQLSFQPYDGSGNAITSRSFSFGRAMPLSGQTRAQADSRRDGLLIEDDAVNHSTEIMCSNELPTIRLVGTKATTTSNGYTEPVCPVIDVQDGTGTTRFAVFDDGFVVQKGHQDTDPDALNSGHFGSVIAGDNSVYVGSSRLSYDRTAHKLTLHTLKHQIPTFLQSAGLPSASVPLALDAMTVHGWVALARTYLSNSRLQVSDVLPFANSGDWDVADAPTPTLTADVARLVGSVEVHVDVSQTGTYVEDGSAARPYKTLQGALSAKLVDGGTGSYIFKLRTGTYNVGSGISITHTNATMKFTIQGESDGVVIHCTDITTDVLYFRRFQAVIFRRLNIAQGKYGLYLRDCTTAQLDSVNFTALGSTAVAANHDFTNTQAEQAAVWASATTSDGGACRIRDSTKVDIQHCFVNKCLRGLRLQDINSTIDVSSIVANNTTMDTLESGIYLASGTYGFANNASTGCRHVLVSGNNIVNAYNNGILNIGSRACSFIGNSIYHSANAGIQQHASVDCSYVSNVLLDCNSLSHNGIGNLGDAWGNIHLTTNTGIDANSGTYLAAVKGNTVLNCGQGRASSVVGIKVLDAGVTYPANYKVVLDSNVTHDGTVENPESVPVVGGSDLSAYSTTAQMNTALALKQDTINLTASKAVVTHSDGTLRVSSCSSSELAYVSGVTSAIQTQLDAKEDTINLTASRAVVSGSGGALRALSVTSAQVGYLGDVTSDLQAQLDAKQDVISNSAQSSVNYTQAQQTFTITGTGTAKRVSLPIVYAWNFTSGTKRITVDWETSQATSTSVVECTVFVHENFNFNNAIGRPRIVEVSGSTNTVRHKFNIQTSDTTDYSSNTSTSLTVNLRII